MLWNASTEAPGPGAANTHSNSQEGQTHRQAPVSVPPTAKAPVVDVALDPKAVSALL